MLLWIIGILVYLVVGFKVAIWTCKAAGDVPSENTFQIFLFTLFWAVLIPVCILRKCFKKFVSIFD